MSRKSHQLQSKNMMGYNNFAFDDLVSQAFSDDFFGDFGFNSGFGRMGMGMGNMGNRQLRGNDDDGFGFSNFGSFGGFGNNMMMEFNSMNSGGMGGKGTCISKSYVSSVQYDKDGKPQRQEFSSQAIDQIGKDGTKISEKKSIYKDSEKGVKKASNQRTLNDVGHKIVKTKDYKTMNESENHYYKGFNESKLNFIKLYS